MSIRPSQSEPLCAAWSGPNAGEMRALLPARAGGAAWSSSFLEFRMLSVHFSPGGQRDTATGDEGPVPKLPVSLWRVDKTFTS